MMYNEPYNYRQQATYQQDTSWLNGNLDFFTKIMGFSFFASLFGGLSGVPGDGDRTGGAIVGGGQASYVWNTIRLVLLGLFVETGRRFCQWIIQRVKFRQCRRFCWLSI
jgi:chaperone BCS1